jgi:AcrR family transcriptional regulator
MNERRARRTRQDMSQTTITFLIEKAREFFSRDGFQNASMDELCSAAGLTRGALYHHFSNKEGLFREVVRTIDREHAQALQATEQRLSDRRSSVTYITLVYLGLALNKDSSRILLQDLNAVLSPEESKDALKATRAVLQAHLTESSPDRARLILSTTHEIARLLQTVPHTSQQAEALRALLCDTVSVLSAAPGERQAANANWREE